MTEQISAPLTRLKDRDFRQLAAFIESQIGIRMPRSKRSLIETRLQKRLRALDMNDYGHYIEYLFSIEGKTRELPFFIDEVTTNKTSFFRESTQFDLLAALLREDRGLTQRHGLTAWSVASSTGEESYTLAMIFEEHRKLDPLFFYSVIGTDISSSVLATAKTAVYDMKDLDAVPDAFVKPYFLRGTGSRTGQIRIHPIIRKNVRFSQINLLGDEYRIETGLGVIFCRNVLIYFDKDRQEKIVRRLIDHLRPGGYLFMGPTEGLLDAHRPLSRVAASIFRKPNSYV